MTWIEDHTQTYPTQHHADHGQSKKFVCDVERKGWTRLRTTTKYLNDAFLRTYPRRSATHAVLDI